MAIQRNNERQKSELDSLFENVGLYRKSSDYMGLLNFVKKFPMLAPYNAFLLHVQNRAVYMWKPNQGGANITTGPLKQVQDRWYCSSRSVRLSSSMTSQTRKVRRMKDITDCFIRLMLKSLKIRAGSGK